MPNNHNLSQAHRRKPCASQIVCLISKPKNPQPKKVSKDQTYAGHVIHTEMKRAIQERTKKLVTAMDMGPRTHVQTGGGVHDRDVIMIDDSNDH